MTERKNEYGVTGAQEVEEGDVLVDGGNSYWIARMPHGFGAHAYGHSEPVVRERQEGRIESFLGEYAEAPHSSRKESP